MMRASRARTLISRARELLKPVVEAPATRAGPDMRSPRMTREGDDAARPRRSSCAIVRCSPAASAPRPWRQTSRARASRGSSSLSLRAASDALAAAAERYRLHRGVRVIVERRRFAR
jgi:hypothetical protein